MTPSTTSVENRVGVKGVHSQFLPGCIETDWVGRHPDAYAQGPPHLGYLNCLNPPYLWD